MRNAFATVWGICIFVCTYLIFRELKGFDPLIQDFFSVSPFPFEFIPTEALMATLFGMTAAGGIILGGTSAWHFSFLLCNLLTIFLAGFTLNMLLVVGFDANVFAGWMFLQASIFAFGITSLIPGYFFNDIRPIPA